MVNPLLDLFSEDTSTPDDLGVLLASLQGGGFGGPVNLTGATQEQSPIPALPWQQQPVQQQPTGDIKTRLMEALGAKEPDQGGTISDILSSRFGNNASGPSYGDYAQGVVKSAMGTPTLGPEVTQERTSGLMKQMQSIANLEQMQAKADLYKRGGTGSNGATMQIIQGLMASNPGMTFDQALYQYQTGNRTGTNLTPTGINMMPGKTDTLKNTSRATTAGGNEADIITAAQADLPNIVNNADIAIKTVKSALNHPGLEANFGKMGVLPNIPGGDAADAATYLDQIKGQGFMASFDRLRGGGQISNVEGDKATNAYVRMQRAQSAASFRVAAQDFLNAVEKSVNVVKQKASGAVFNQQSTANQPQMGQSQPPPEAKQAPDGNYYLPDPNRPGKYLQWQP